ncbi:hypothetical protein [uncultured Sphingomonas sp.]|uniref:hypothetical protein n=1 Tax=uncultured Sphingomonas sp. TaxID=158754 RepID=UPI0025E837A2|nr:hypothetical protein [uncultured Sphingomonas sp.]
MTFASLATFTVASGPTTAIAAIVIGLRVIAATLALYNLWWSASGALALMRGRFRPPEIFLSFVFWMAMVTLVFQASYLSGQTDWWRLAAYTVLVVAMGLAAIGYAQGAKMQASAFFDAYDHLGVAMSIVDLARIDPAAAAEIAVECRRLTAARMLARG